MTRDWSIYERNQLIKYGIAENELAKYGEMPVEYITGWAEFDGMEFRVNKDVLIPRVESVQILAEAEKIVGGRTLVTFAEIGAGCGAIGIALNRRLKNKGKRIKGVLVDVSEPAVEIARSNYRRLLPEDTNLEIYRSDLMDEVGEPARFDLIIANLPYIPSSRVPRLPESVVNYEPHLALDGGVDGMTLIKKLLTQAGTRLESEGAIILEIDYSHDISDFVDVSGYRYEVRQDEFGQNRFLLARTR